jgi:hypothetical protein
MPRRRVQIVLSVKAAALTNATQRTSLPAVMRDSATLQCPRLMALLSRGTLALRALSRGTIRDLDATRVDPQRRVAIPLTNVAGVTMGPFKPSSANDSWEGRLRVQRDF